MKYKKALQWAQEIEQEHIFECWAELSSSEKQQLLGQCHSLDLGTFKHQQALLIHREERLPSLSYTPLETSYLSTDPLLVQSGRDALKLNKVACLIVAGGMASRLGVQAPKGTIPVSVVKGKSLFQIFAEKILAAEQQNQCEIPLAIMSSLQNHEAICDFFQKHHFFGLRKGQLDIFPQGTLPFLDDHGDLLLESPGRIAEGPRGNGEALSALYLSGVWKKWKALGIECFHFIQVDNPLVDPVDAALTGLHLLNQDDVTIQSFARVDPQEKVGVIVQGEQGIRVIEYSEMKKEDASAKRSDGTLLYQAANMSHFCFNMPFIERIYDSEPRYHLAKKQVKDCFAWKFEFFIFDCFEHSDKCSVVMKEKRLCFSPLKNAKGNDSLVTVQAALQRRDCEVYTALTGEDPPAVPFELPQEFYYPTELFSPQDWY